MMYYIAEVTSRAGKGILKTEIVKGSPRFLSSKIREYKVVEKIKVLYRLDFLHVNARVRYKRDLVVGKKYGDVTFTEAMSKLNAVRIEDFRGSLVYLNDGFIATVEMLEEIPKRLVGSTVRIRKELPEGTDVPFGINKHMADLAGTEQVISSVESTYIGSSMITKYRLEGIGWNWSEGMFELEEV